MPVVKASGTVAPVASRPMRQVLSWRFLAAIGALAGLALFVNVAFVGKSDVASIIGPTEPEVRRPELISLVLETQSNGFAMSDGRAEGELTLQLPSGNPLRIFPGTPGQVTCPDLSAFGQCALLAELLGDSISWFALVPMGASFRFQLPPIVELDGGLARLANGWEVPYAPVIDRSRCDPQVESFSEFLRTVGQRHTALFDIGRGEITAVQC